MVWLGKDTDVAQAVIVFGIQGVVDRSTTEGVRTQEDGLSCAHKERAWEACTD
jgi:hypothetical protein